MKTIEMYSSMVIKPLEEYKKELIRKLYSFNSEKEVIKKLIEDVDKELYKKYVKLSQIAKEEFEFNDGIVENNNTN